MASHIVAQKIPASVPAVTEDFIDEVINNDGVKKINIKKFLIDRTLATSIEPKSKVVAPTKPAVDGTVSTNLVNLQTSHLTLIA